MCEGKAHPIKKWDVIHVSAGEYHGTIAGPNGLTCVSSQSPIDYALYKGGTQPKKAGKAKRSMKRDS